MIQTLDDVIVKPEIVPYDETEENGDTRTHIVNPPHNIHIWEPGMSMQTTVDLARLREVPLVALCGYTFIPKKNPDKFPACEECVKIAGELMRGAGE